jgi:Cupin-like domain
MRILKIPIPNRLSAMVQDRRGCGFGLWYATSGTRLSLLELERMKRPHSSTAVRRKPPVFLDPAFPSYRGYLPQAPPPTASGWEDDGDRDDDYDDSDDDDRITRRTGTGRPQLGLDRVDAASVSPQEFFEAYVARRKPCLLFNVVGVESTTSGEDVNADTANNNNNNNNLSGPNGSATPVATDPASLLLQHLRSKLIHDTFQMEVRETCRDAFGQNRTEPGRQVDMTFGEFIDKVPAPRKHLYYLSTQQQRSKNVEMEGRGEGEDDEEEEDRYDAAGGRLADALEESSSACPNVARALERVQTLAGSLVLDSKHGWLGFAPPAPPVDDGGGEGVVSPPPPLQSCSGLHHDFHDNFNVQLVGTKRWTLYPPTEYPNIPLFGTVHGIHGFNGLICYRDSVTRADGVPLAVLMQDDDDEEEGDDDEHEGTKSAFGNPNDGEDSENDEDDGVGDGEDDLAGNALNGVDDDEDTDTRNSKALATTAGRSDRASNGHRETQRRPSSFSPVDMRLSAEDRARKHPDFCPKHEINVEVRAGEALYLPASWFHSVSSAAADAGCSEVAKTASSAESVFLHPPYHLAVNYWYHPPDQDSFQQPYRNDYWAKNTKTKATKNY